MLFFFSFSDGAIHGEGNMSVFASKVYLEKLKEALDTAGVAVTVWDKVKDLVAAQTMSVLQVAVISIINTRIK